MDKARTITLTVQVRGYASSGKTTLLCAIEDAVKKLWPGSTTKMVEPTAVADLGYPNSVEILVIQRKWDARG